MTGVKICGMTDPAHFEELAALPVDYVGFVFAPSRRRLDLAAFARMNLDSLDGLKTVGVFVNPTVEWIEEVVAANRLDMIQLHGDESPEFCRRVKERFGKPVIKAVKSGQYEMLCRQEPFFDILLVDSSSPQGFGGLGVPFDWTVIPRFQRLARGWGIPLWVAGGIHEGNVGELIASYHPDLVDCSSGVETDGVKDMEKIRRFVGKVKGYDPNSGAQ